MALELKGTVSLDGSGWESGLKRMEHATARTADSLKEFAAEAFGLYAIKEATQKTIEFADQLINTAKRVDLTVERLQVLRQAAKNAGVEFDKIPIALEKINIAREKALGGGPESGKFMEAFSKLGVGVGDLKNRNASDILFGPMADTTRAKNVQEVNAAFAALGKGLNAVIPLLRQNFNEVQNSLEKFGLIMDTETAVKLHHVGDELSLISTALTLAFAPAILKAVDAILDGFGSLLDWLDRKVRGEEPAKTNASSGFFGKTAAMGGAIGAGLLGLGNEALAQVGFPGAQKKSDERFDQFLSLSGKSFGFMSSGFLMQAADAMVKQMNQGGRMGDSFKKLRGEYDKMIQDEIERMKHPPAADAETQVFGKEKSSRGGGGRISSDALTRVGNFLGANTRDALTSIAERQLHVLHEIAHNTKRTKRAEGNFEFPGSIDLPS